jgi:hypothetical protein
MAERYEKAGYGWAAKHPKYDPNKKYPMFTGDVTVGGEKLGIALWRTIKYGKESFSIQFTKDTEDDGSQTSNQVQP